ncbi:MAG: hypothetical protein XE11_2148 [Methanomicrobiales archaeon 53_19]|jgi:hypothetical protein|nr:MAG: hypothetical protein XE11_2148 [Methanomicrobiales archaeon 53_19]
MLSRGSGCRDRQIPSERTGKNQSIYSVLLMSQQTTASFLLRRCFPRRETLLLSLRYRCELCTNTSWQGGVSPVGSALTALPFPKTAWGFSGRTEVGE